MPGVILRVSNSSGNPAWSTSNPGTPGLGHLLGAGLKLVYLTPKAAMSKTLASSSPGTKESAGLGQGTGINSSCPVEPIIIFTS